MNFVPFSVENELLMVIPETVVCLLAEPIFWYNVDGLFVLYGQFLLVPYV